MSKKQALTYTYVTLFKPEIKELIDIFQTNLQDVVIIIDEQGILESTQLDQFDATYQAKSLLMRGYQSAIAGDSSEGQREQQLVELKMSRSSAVLSSWKEAGAVEPEMLVQVKRLLLSRHNRVHQFLVLFSAMCLFGIFVTLQPLAYYYNFNLIEQVLLEVVGALILVPITIFLYSVVVRFFKLGTRIFLFPGATKGTRIYGRRETIGAVFVALFLIMLMTLAVNLASRAVITTGVIPNLVPGTSYNKGYQQGIQDAQATITARAKR